MNIKDLIKNLLELHEKHGDLPVFLRDYEVGWDYNVVDVEFRPKLKDEQDDVYYKPLPDRITLSY